MARRVKDPTKPRRGVIVDVPRTAGPEVAYAWLHRKADGGFHLSLWRADGRLAPGSSSAVDPGRPASLWAEARSRPHLPPEAALARAKRLAARRAPPVEQVEEAWQPPAVLPTPRLPRTPEGTARTLRKLARRRRRFEMIQMTDPAVEMPLVVPGPPVSIEEGQRELQRRYEVACLAARHNMTYQAASELHELM